MMSKQLAISSAFAVLAMAAMTLTMTAGIDAHSAGGTVTPVVVDTPEFRLPGVPFLPTR